MSLARALAVAGAGAAGVAAWLASRRARETAAATAGAVASGGTFQARLTGYWPFTATEAEKKMEGGPRGAAVWRGRRVVDRHTGKRAYLHTLEQHLRDPQAYPYVSVSADPEVFPFGQRLSLSPWPEALFRVVDTGGHFTNAGKVYRVLGREPLDICVDSKKTRVPKDAVTATIHKGDHFDRPGAEVAASKFRGQQVVIGDDLDLLDAEEG